MYIMGVFPPALVRKDLRGCSFGSANEYKLLEKDPDRDSDIHEYFVCGSCEHRGESKASARKGIDEWLEHKIQCKQLQ